MQTKDTIAQSTDKTRPSEKLYMENTLLRISGALFCHDPKRAAARVGEIELNRDVDEKHIVIRPDPTLGQPGQLAHKVFIALIKKHSGYGRPVPKEVSFTKREVMRLIGRKTWGGRDSEELARALHEIHHTFITTKFRSGDGRYIQHSFNVFPEILLERREFASDPIERCTIILAAPIIESLHDEHFTCLNHALMMRLGTIGQAIYMRLFFHFANHYDGRNGARLNFQKRYDDICAEWLGGIKVYTARSKIIGEQIGSHLDLLVAEGFLASYAMQPAKTRDGFVLTFRPGEVFFRDYNRFYRSRRQGELQFDFHGDRRETSEPLKVAYMFAMRRTGETVNSPDFVPSSDVTAAKQLLEEIPFEEMSAFIDFALIEARKTSYDVRTLSGIKKYLPDYRAKKRRKTANEVNILSRQEEQRQEATLLAYQRARRTEAEQVFETLPADEQEDIRAHARDRGGRLGDVMSEFHTVNVVIERHGDRLKSFKQWQANRIDA